MGKRSGQERGFVGEKIVVEIDDGETWKEVCEEVQKQEYLAVGKK